MPMTDMTDEEYQTTQHQLMLFAGILKDMNLLGFLARVGQAETVGPILDPTLYKKGMDKLQMVKRVAQAFQAAQHRLPSDKELTRVFNGD